LAIAELMIGYGFGTGKIFVQKLDFSLVVFLGIDMFTPYGDKNKGY